MSSTSAIRRTKVIAATHQDIEITDEAAVRELVSRIRPETVINTAAYNRVDDCEIDPDIAFTVKHCCAGLTWHEPVRR